MTDVLLVGGGGREHALAWKLAQSPGLGRMVAAPGNPGIAAHARCVPVKDTAVDELVDLARQERPDLVVVGPEVPLALGLGDRLRAAGFAVFGPSAAVHWRRYLELDLGSPWAKIARAHLEEGADPSGDAETDE